MPTIVFGFGLADKNHHGELGVFSMGMSRVLHFVLRTSTKTQHRPFGRQGKCIDFFRTLSFYTSWVDIEMANVFQKKQKNSRV